MFTNHVSSLYIYEGTTSECELPITCLFADVENLEPPMVDAFEMVLMLLPRPPSNPVYKEFLIKSREYSYQSPFNAPLPPLPNLSIPVRPISTSDIPCLTNNPEQW